MLTQVGRVLTSVEWSRVLCICAKGRKQVYFYPPSYVYFSFIHLEIFFLKYINWQWIVMAYLEVLMQFIVFVGLISSQHFEILTAFVRSDEGSLLLDMPIIM